MKTDADLAALAEEQNVDCTVAIAETELTTLDAMQGLRSAFAFSVRSNPELRNISELSNVAAELVTITSIPFEGHFDVPDTVALTVADVPVQSLTSNRRSHGHLILRNVPALRSVELLEAVSIADLSISLAPVLELPTTTFPKLSNVSSASVRDCPLVTMAQLEALAEHLPDEVELQHCGNADDAPCTD